MDSFLADFRHSARVLWKNPAFTLVAIAALALGIGANTAIFSVVNTVLLKPLPYPNPDRIVRIARKFKSGRSDSTSIPKFMAWQKNDAFESMALYDMIGPGLNLGGGDRPEQVKGIHVSSSYFRVFGVSTAYGRTFTREEDQPNGPKTAVLTYQLWKDRFGGDPALIGKAVNLSGDSYAIVGVLPASFVPDPPTDVFIPLQADPNSTNQGHYLLAAGRLKDGVQLQAAQAQMKVIAEEFQRQHPQFTDGGETVALIPLRDALVGDVRPALLILLGAVSFVLLIACANVANLLLARATGRQKEIAIRTAIGAGRFRIVRQLLTESLLLAVAGAIAGLAIGVWGMRLLLAFSPGNIPRINDQLHSSGILSALDWRVLCFTLGVTLLTGLLFGLFPAIQISRFDVNSTLKENSGRSGTGLRQNRARGALVVSEIALALILLIGAALMIRTFVGLRSVQPGFDPHHLLTLQTSMTGGHYSTTAQIDNLVRQMVPRLEALPGVESAASAVMLPIEGGIDLPFVIEGRPPKKGDLFTGDEQWRSISAHYFQAFKIPLHRGRVFDDRDTGKSARVVIINDAMAKKYWPNESPIGRIITIGKGIGREFEEPSRQIVGIVGSVRETGLSDSEQPVMYIPAAQVLDSVTTLANNVVPFSWVVRTSMDPLALSTAVQKEFLAVDGQLPVSKIRSMEQVMTESTARQNFNMLLLSIFAGMALLLAAIGIYGLMSYSVQQRTQEIGIRMALGAGRREMLRLVMVQGLWLAGIGVVLGAAAAYGLTRLLAGLLFGVKAGDPLTFAAVSMALVAVAMLASFVPAQRATRIDPIIALRYE
jgi:putative ABC transport system permease protein